MKKKALWFSAAFILIVWANVAWAMKFTLPPLAHLTGSNIVVRKVETEGRVRMRSEAKNDWVTADFFLPQAPHGWYGIVELSVNGKTEQSGMLLGPLADGMQTTTISYRLTDEYDKVVGDLAKQQGVKLAPEKTTFVTEMVVKNRFPAHKNYSAGYTISNGPRYVASLPFERSLTNYSMGWGFVSSQTVPLDTKILLAERYVMDVSKSHAPISGGWSDDREEMLLQQGAHTIFLYIRFERAEKLFPNQFPQATP